MGFIGRSVVQLIFVALTRGRRKMDIKKAFRFGIFLAVLAASRKASFAGTRRYTQSLAVMAAVSGAAPNQCRGSLVSPLSHARHTLAASTLLPQ